MEMYRAQHTGNSKLHLLDDDFKVMCGSKGEFIFDTTLKVSIVSGQPMEFCDTMNNDQTGLPIFEPQYCRKCIKKLKTLNP